MVRKLAFGVAAAIAAFAGPVVAQPVDLPVEAATTTEFPKGVAVASAPGGQVYVDGAGHTLYGLDMRALLRSGANPAKYCESRCADWEPMLAPPDAKANVAYVKKFFAGDDEAQKRFVDPTKAADWSIIDGPRGPQWVYKGWHMVFTRKNDAPRSVGYDGAENFRWNTLKYVPPVPDLIAPPRVVAKFLDGRYVLADGEGNLLFSGACSDCGAWTPLAGGMASRALGKWAIKRDGDVPQWTYRGQPVFVAAGSALADLPAGAQALDADGSKSGRLAADVLRSSLPTGGE